MVSLKDIAADAGVSISLVSKILNDRLGTTGTARETKEKVLESAGRLGYKKNISAAALKSGRHNTIGVYIHHVGIGGSQMMEDLVVSISKTAMEHRLRLVLAFFETVEALEDLCDGAHPNSMDGLILAGLNNGEYHRPLQRVKATGLPIVTIYDEKADPDVENIGMDQKVLGFEAARYLIRKGAVHIAHILTDSSRTEGYCQAMREEGLEADKALIFKSASYTYESGLMAAKHFISSGRKFDAVFAQSDQQAAGCIRGLADGGLAVPRDVMVLGVDNSPYCDFMTVPISSVSQQMHPRGREAVEVLNCLIEGRPVRIRRFSPEIVERTSTMR